MLRRVIVAAAFASAAFQFSPAFAEDRAAPTEAYEISRGGQLYDKWWTLLKVAEPEGNHPLYPAAGQKKGSTTWRCKECHGWDYKGAEGAYAPGTSRYTGIKGISGKMGADPQDIVTSLRGPHAYTPAMLSDEAVRELALFVTKGQIDPQPFIDAGNKSLGDAGKGQAYYQNLCSGCHGLDGKKITTADPLSAVASNGVEMMHKILNGQPPEAMPALRDLDPQITADIVAHLQTFPQ